MAQRFPRPGDIYDSNFFPGQQCKVVRVLGSEITMQWIGAYAHLGSQTVPVNQFIRDFTLAPTVDGE